MNAADANTCGNIPHSFNHSPKTLSFEGNELTVVDHKGQPWLRATQIGTALGYKKENAISRLYLRNKDEFTADMTESVKLTLSGNLQKEVRIFSPRGCHLLAMLSKTDRAKQFRAWVLDVLEKQNGESENTTTAITETPTTDVQHFITTQIPGQAPQTRLLDAATLLELSNDFPEFCLVPTRQLESMVELMSTASSKGIDLLQFGKRHNH